MRNMGGKQKKKGGGFHRDTWTEKKSSGGPGATGKGKKYEADEASSVAQASSIRNQVDPETSKYFSEIENVIEGTEIDIEVRSVICGTALEEARGKEVELATDYIISHTMQRLLEGCSLDHLCSFLRSCARSFSHIAMDKSGSHVAETALKSLSMHLQDYEAHSLIDETLTTLCHAVVVNPVDIMMCNCYGSHVLRRLICLCKGVPMDSSEFRGKKPSIQLVERLNLRSQVDVHVVQQNPPFPDQLKFLISELFNPSRVDIWTLQVNQYSSLVLQTALKSLVGQEQELFRTISILFGSNGESASEGNKLEVSSLEKSHRLVKENAYSHLMEVILEVAPDGLYDEIFRKVFKNFLFDMSKHPCANFVVQSLISHARSQEHIKLIWEELGSKFEALLKEKMVGVVAVFLAASQRLQIFEPKCCEALAHAVCLSNESSTPIVPRILYIGDFFYSNDKENWKWPNGAPMNAIGSLILQSVFRLPSEHIQAYITSMISLEDYQVLEASKDSSGSRVIEAFLSSSASAKQKRKLVFKLRGHFGELSVHPSGSFTIDKYFNVSNLALKETIVSELLPVQTELSKTKQGPYLLKKLDVEGFARRPDQWRSRLNSKESAYKEFYAAFGPNESKSSRSENFVASNTHKSHPENLRGMREEIQTRLFAGKSGAPFLAHHGSTKPKHAGNKVPDSRGGHGSFNGKRKRRGMGNTSL